MKSLTELLGSHRLVVVPPSRTSDGRYVEASCPLDIEHRAVIDQVQRFRGRIYVDDGALPPDALDRFGRHYSDFDDSCHHLLVVDDQDAVEGCVRIRFYRSAPHPEDLHLWKSVADAPRAFGANGSGATVRCEAISAHIDRAFDQRGSLIEIGGFAVDERIRRSGKAIVLAAGCWSITRALAPSLGVALVTSRHGFNRILMRLGGFELGCGSGDVDGDGNGNGDASRDSDIHPLSFFDRHYGCNVDVLGFDTWKVNPEIESLVEEMEREIRRLLGVGGSSSDSKSELGRSAHPTAVHPPIAFASASAANAPPTSKLELP